MSTLKVTNLQHPSAASANVTLDSSGNAAFSDGITGVTSVNGGQLGGSNIIINGAMECSQRGNYSSAVSLSDDTYYLDRWVSDLAGVSATIQNVSNGYLSKIKTQKLAATSSATGRLVSIQKIEVSGYMLGVELTASAQVKSNSSDARLFLVDNTNGTVLGVQAHTGGGAFEKLIVSGTPPTSCTDLRVYVALRGAAQENVAITSGDYFEFTEVQLEIGSTPTSYQHESYGTTLQKCERYFQRSWHTASNSGNSNVYPGVVTGVAQDTGSLNAAVQFRTQLRATPTFTFYRDGVAGRLWNVNTAGTVTASLSQSWYDINGINGMPLSGGVLTAGVRYGFDFDVDAEL